MQWLNLNCPLRLRRVIGRKILAYLGGHGCEPCLSLRQRQARLQSTDSVAQNPGTTRWLGKGLSHESSGAKHLYVARNGRSRMAKFTWQNPNNGQGIIVEPEGAADNVRISAIGTTP